MERSFLLGELAASLLAAAALAACGDEGAKPPVDTVPAGLHAVESAAEDAFDHARAGDGAALAADAKKVPEVWQAFHAQALKDGAKQADVDRLDAAVDAFVNATQASSDGLTLARAANAMSEPMDE